MTGQTTDWARVISTAAGITATGSSKRKPGTIIASSASSTACTTTTLTSAGTRKTDVGSREWFEEARGREVPAICDPPLAIHYLLSPHHLITLVRTSE